MQVEARFLTRGDTVKVHGVWCMVMGVGMSEGLVTLEMADGGGFRCWPQFPADLQVVVGAAS